MRALIELTQLDLASVLDSFRLAVPSQNVHRLQHAMATQLAKSGGLRHPQGAVYVGEWNGDGRRHGHGHLVLADGTRYDGHFEDGLYEGLGIVAFPDGAKYEGELMRGWFHGCGTFWRADGMKYEGEFRGGRIWGLGLVTYRDGSHGFLRNEGLFQDCRLVRKKRCPDVVQRAQKIAMMARATCE